MRIISLGNRFHFYDHMITHKLGVEGMALIQPFPLPFALTNFYLLVEGQHMGRCLLFPRGCQVSASLQLLFARRELLRCYPYLLC